MIKNSMSCDARSLTITISRMHAVCQLRPFIITLILQILEIQAEPLVGQRQALGVLYGVDQKRLECPLGDLHSFDITR